jgi:hypothetical protein
MDVGYTKRIESVEVRDIILLVRVENRNHCPPKSGYSSHHDRRES